MKRRMFSAVAGAAVATALLATTAVAGGSRTPNHDFTEARVAQTQSEYYVVTFKDPPAASYAGGIGDLKRTKPQRGAQLNPKSAEVLAYVDHLKSVHADYRGWMASKARKAETVREYVLVANALAIKLNGTKPETLAQGPGVDKVTASWLYKPAMNASTRLINADDVWPLAGGQANAGAGQKVGIIDSGIDDSHEFFACKGSISHKVYASGVALDTTNVLVNDHGTHVAGTVAGCVTNATSGPITSLSGVAPAAELHDYNVFPGFGSGWVAFGGSAFSHDIAAALEDAVADGMDVVNMSLGGTVQGPHDLLAEVTNAVADAGVVPAVAAGNSGPGDSTVESPGSAAGALTAGASTNSHVIAFFAHVTSASGTKAYVAAAGDFDPFAATKATGQSLANWAATGGDITACNAAPNNAPVQGKIALISRGACSFTTKIRNAQNAGAFGVIVYNNAGEAVAMGHDGTSPFPTIPAVMIGQADGADAIANLPSTAVIDGSSLQELPATPDVLAGFSSRGPTPFTYLIKPDLTAPGVNIWSSVFNNGYASFQGTSMATPHLAGAAALLLQLNADWSPADVKSALVNNAARVVTENGSDPGVLARGGGRADVAAANAATVLSDPASASFGFSTGSKAVTGTVTLALRANGSDRMCSVAVTGDPYVTASSTAVTVPASGTTLTLSLDAGRSTPSGDYDGDVVLTCGSDTVTIPWWTRIDRQAKP